MDKFWENDPIVSSGSDGDDWWANDPIVSAPEPARRDGIAEIGAGIERVAEFGRPTREAARAVPSRRDRPWGGVGMRGGAGLIAGGQQNAAQFGRGQIDAMDRLDRGEAVSEMDDAMGYQHMDAEQRAAARAEAEAARDAFNPGKVEDSPLYRAGQAVTEFGDNLFPPAPGYEDSTGRMIGQGLGSVVAGIAASVVTGPAGAGALFALTGAGEAVDRAIAEGATEEQILQSAKLGIIPGMTDSIPIEVLLGRIPLPGVGRIQVPPGLLGAAMRAMGRMGTQAFVEALQEGGQEFLQNVIAQNVYKPEQELFEDVPEGAGLGAAVGAITEALFTPFRRRGGSGSEASTSTPVQPSAPTTPEFGADAGVAPAAATPAQPGQPVAGIPEGAQPGEAVIGSVDEQSAPTSPAQREGMAVPPPVVDRERADSPRLTPEDRAVPTPNDLIDDGKQIVERALRGEAPVSDTTMRADTPASQIAPETQGQQQAGSEERAGWEPLFNDNNEQIGWVEQATGKMRRLSQGLPPVAATPAPAPSAPEVTATPPVAAPVAPTNRAEYVESVRQLGEGLNDGDMVIDDVTGVEWTIRKTTSARGTTKLEFDGGGRGENSFWFQTRDGETKAVGNVWLPQGYRVEKAASARAPAREEVPASAETDGAPVTATTTEGLPEGYRVDTQGNSLVLVGPDGIMVGADAISPDGMRTLTNIARNRANRGEDQPAQSKPDQEPQAVAPQGSAPVESPAPAVPINSARSIEPYTDKSIIVRGVSQAEGEALFADMKARPLWNAVQKAWVFSKKHEAAVRERIEVSVSTPPAPKMETPAKADELKSSPPAAPTGPRVMVNLVGRDGKTDAERGGPLVPEAGVVAWADAKPGDVLNSAGMTLIRKGITTKAEARALSEGEPGRTTVMQDGPRKWAVVREGEAAKQKDAPVRITTPERAARSEWNGTSDTDRLAAIRTAGLYGTVSPRARWEELAPDRQASLLDAIRNPRPSPSNQDVLKAAQDSGRLEIVSVNDKPKAEPKAKPRPESKGYGEGNKLVSKDRAAELRKRLKDKLNQINSGIDPEIIAIGTELTVFHIEAGTRKFMDVAAALAADLDTPLSKLRPYLRSWYGGARDLMEDSGISIEGMDDGQTVRDALGDIDALIAEQAKAETGTPPRDTVTPPAEEASDAGRGNQAGATDGGLRSGTRDVPAREPPEGARPNEGDGPAEGALPGDRRGSRRDVADDRGADADQSASTGRDEGADGVLPVDTARGGRTRNGGSGQRSAVKAKAEKEVADDRASRARRNYRITEADEIGKGGPKAKVRANIAAIRTLKQIEEEGRAATPDEKKILVKYTGWGAFAQPIFDRAKRPEWAEERAAVFDLLTPEEVASARKSTLNAHYTSPEVIEGMWQALDHLGFKGGRALEPSAGVGHFIGLTPKKVLNDTAWSAVELDTTTGRIASLLYDGSDVNVMGFEQFNRPDGFFDLAISNVPFGDFTIRDTKRPGYLIHDYFFIKALDMVRPGGMVAFITSDGTMDKIDTKARDAMLARADFVGAIRLPGGDKGAFAGNAGTQVTTDIIFLRPRAKGTPAQHIGNFRDLKTVQTPEGPTQINAYFAANPDMMLGEMRKLGTMYRADQKVLIGDVTDLDKKIAAAAKKMPKNAILPRGPTAQKITKESAKIDAEASGTVKEGAFYLKAGKPYRKVNGVGQPAKMSAADLKKLPDFIAMRDIVNDLLRGQATGQKDANAHLRQKLNAAYDKFVKAHGPINQVVETVQERTDKKTGETRSITIRKYPNFNPFSEDPDAFKTAAIESYDEATGKASKAAIFKEDIVGSYTPPEITGPTDAIAVSLNQTGKIDLPTIATQLNMSEEQAIEAMGDLIYLDPAGDQWRTANEYLSGDVVTRLEEARAAAKTEPGKYARNVEALQNVQPTPLTRVDIRLQFGAPWIPTDIYEAFLTSIGGRGVKVRMNPMTKAVQVSDGAFDQSAQTRFGTDRAGVMEVANAALKQTRFKVYDKDANGDAVVNEKATQEVLQKINAIREEFIGIQDAGVEGWAFADEARGDRLEALYNAALNRLVPTVYDGSHLALPGLAKTIIGRDGDPVAFDLRPHQKDAVWRVIQSGNALLDHVVGAGKTFTMIAAGMEQKRLGLIQRPMYAVPNHMLEQFSREFYQAYPNAKLLIATKDQMTKARRKEFAARVAADKWDGIIITHDAFGRIRMSDQAVADYLNTEVDRLQVAADAAREEEGAKSRTVKEIEKAKEKLETRIKDLMNVERKDEGVTFEELGVDYIVVDEAHLFKNLRTPTRHTRVKGIGKTASQRAEDLFMKIQTLEKNRPGRSVLFATGTPISNTMAEMYTMQRYLQNDTLREYGIDEFDAWAATFGSIETAMELSPNGRTMQEVTSFRSFINIPELVALYSRVADVKTAEMLNLPRPTLKGGAIKVVEAEPSDAEEAYIASLVERADFLKKNPQPPTKGADNMLKIVSEGRKVAIDFRLIEPGAAMNPEGKVAKLVSNVARIHKEGKHPALAQLIFLDMGVPQKAGQSQAVDPARDDDAVDTVMDDGGQNTDDGDNLMLLPKNAPAKARAIVFAARERTLQMASEGASLPALSEKQRLWLRNNRYANENGLTPNGERELSNASRDLAEIEEGGGEGEAVAVEDSEIYKTKFDLYNDIRDKLVADGIPRKEIAFIHEATDDVKKAALFRKVRSGEVRVLLGSTGKMGVGTNVQKLLYAMHHVDAPWKPAEVEQRDGRIIRQGNENAEVEMYRYITKRSFDSFMWQALERKSKFIGQIKAGARGIRSAEDIDDPLPEAATLKAAASGDPRIMEHAELTKEVRDLDNLARNHDRDIQRAKGNLNNTREELKRIEAQKSKLDADRKSVKDVSGDKFTVDLAFAQGRGPVTDRKAAGELVRKFLLDSGGNLWGSSPTTWTVGEIGGLTMKVEAQRRSEGIAVQPFVEGEGRYLSGQFILSEDGDPIGLMSRFERPLRDIPVMAERMPATIAAKKEEIARLEKQAEPKPFAREARRVEAKRRLIELETALRPKDPAQDASAEPGETLMAARREGDAQGEAQSGDTTIREDGGRFAFEMTTSARFQQKRDAVFAELRQQLDALGLPDVALRVSDRIGLFIDGIADGNLDGVFWKGIVEVALDAKNATTTVRHEAVHAMKQHGALHRTASGRSLPTRAKREWMKKYDIADPDRYGAWTSRRSRSRKRLQRLRELEGGRSIRAA
jgi:N12 class adenine-specific DNA methylase